MNKVCKEYISEIKALFPIKGKQEKMYLKKLRADIEDYCEETSIVTKEDLYQNYGKPQDIMLNYFDTASEEYITKKIRLSNIIKITIIILLASAIIAAVAYAVFVYQYLHVFEQNTIYAPELKPYIIYKGVY